MQGAAAWSPALHSSALVLDGAGLLLSCVAVTRAPPCKMAHGVGRSPSWLLTCTLSRPVPLCLGRRRRAWLYPMAVRRTTCRYLIRRFSRACGSRSISCDAMVTGTLPGPDRSRGSHRWLPHCRASHLALRSVGADDAVAHAALGRACYYRLRGPLLSTPRSCQERRSTHLGILASRPRRLDPRSPRHRCHDRTLRRSRTLGLAPNGLRQPRRQGWPGLRHPRPGGSRGVLAQPPDRPRWTRYDARVGGTTTCVNGGRREASTRSDHHWGSCVCRGSRVLGPGVGLGMIGNEI
jgi:hypothetical protein